MLSRNRKIYQLHLTNEWIDCGVGLMNAWMLMITLMMANQPIADILFCTHAAALNELSEQQQHTPATATDDKSYANGK